MYARNLFRNAYNFSISFGSDINNSFEDAVEGLIKALNSYDLTSPQPFPGYYPFYVYAAMQRNYEKIDTVYEIPNHHYQEMFSFLTTYKVLIEKHGINNFLDYVPERKLTELKENNFIVYNYLRNSYEYDFNNILYDAKIEELALYKALQDALDVLLNTLPEREKEILKLRHGIVDGNELTLEELGQIYGLTRERIRQIESKALKRLRHPRRLNYLYGFYELKENLQYSSETGEFSKLLTRELMFDDIFTKIEILNTNKKNVSEQNEFSDMTQ